MLEYLRRDKGITHRDSCRSLILPPAPPRLRTFLPFSDPYRTCNFSCRTSEKEQTQSLQHTDRFQPESCDFSRATTLFQSPAHSDRRSPVKSPDALRPLTLCNCDCKILTLAICRGLHRYTMRCIHPAQRCISSRQMTENNLRLRRLPWRMRHAPRKNLACS